MRVLLGVIFLALSGFSCATTGTLNENQCLKGDWVSYGTVDGAKGRLGEYFEKHKESCSRFGVKPNWNQYDTGVRQGHKNFCSKEMGYYYGKRGEVPPVVCSGKPLALFKSGFDLGKRVHLLKKERDKRISDLESMESDSGQHEVTDEVREDMKESADDEFRLVQEKRIEKIEDQITSYEATAPNTEAIELADEDRIKKRDNFGFYIGSSIGFGVGHVIQKRYFARGWIYTLGESAGLIGFLAGEDLACKSAPKTCVPLVKVFSGMAFIGFKVWEILDLYRYSEYGYKGYPHLESQTGEASRRKKMSSLMVFPDYNIAAQGPMLSFATIF